MSEIDAQVDSTREAAREIEAEINDCLEDINRRLNRGRVTLVRGRTLTRFIVLGVIAVLGFLLLLAGASNSDHTISTIELSLGANFLASASLFLLIEMNWRTVDTLISEKTALLGILLDWQRQYRHIRKLNGEAVMAEEQGDLDLAQKKQAYCKRKLRQLQHSKQLYKERLKADRLLDNFLSVKDRS